MAGRDEPVRGGEPLERGLELAAAELDHAMAARADEVVVVVVPAPPVADLSGAVGEGVDGAGAREERERPVHGRKPERFSPGAEAGVEILRRHVVALAQELACDRDPLPRRSNAGLGEGASYAVVIFPSPHAVLAYRSLANENHSHIVECSSWR